MQLLFLFLAIIGLAFSARAGDVRIGRATEHGSLDPLYSDLGSDAATAENMFESMVRFDSKIGMHPSLATSWKPIDSLTWDIELRPGVTFHDGSALTAADVAYSLNRARDIPNSPGPLASFVRPVKETEIAGPLTLRIHTLAPAPLLMDMIGRIFVLPAKLGAAVTNDDFNSGRAMIGTGPYRFKSSAPGDSVVWTAYAGYWGGKPEFDTVIVKFLANPAARSAALLSGSVDAIEQIPPSDIGIFQNRADVTLYGAVSTRVVYIGMDQGRDDSPFLTDRDGNPMAVNPLKDKRVRLALSKMVNRPAIVERVLSGAGEPAGQLAPDGMGGHDPSLKPVALDLAGAKQLLNEAGYPNGFGLTVHGSNNRFPNDSQVAQAIGQMFTRGGIRVNGVEAVPYNVYATAATQRKYSVFIFSYGSVASSSLNGLTGVLATYDGAKGTGSFEPGPLFESGVRRDTAPCFRRVRRGEARRPVGRDHQTRHGRCRDPAAVLAETVLGCPEGFRRRPGPGRVHVGEFHPSGAVKAAWRRSSQWGLVLGEIARADPPCTVDEPRVVIETAIDGATRRQLDYYAAV
jgi:peptide/nickel transport system substrate-binding protein